MPWYRKNTDQRILGSMEKIPAIGLITGDPDCNGNPRYIGDSEILWDWQYTEQEECEGSPTFGEDLFYTELMMVVPRSEIEWRVE